MEQVLQAFNKFSSSSEPLQFFVLPLLAVLGGFHLLAHFYRTIQFWSRNCLRCERDLPKRYGKGTWAVITGASDGIGEEYAI